MEITNKEIYLKLQESKDNVEKCNQEIAVINEAIETLNKAMIQSGNTEKIENQIQQLENEIDTLEKANQLFEGHNIQANQTLKQKKEQLTNLRESRILSQTASEAYNTKKTELIEKRKNIINTRQASLDMLENIAEIYDEKAEKIIKKIEDNETNKNEKDEELETLIPRYSELERRLKTLNSFGNIISEKKVAEKNKIIEEIEEIRGKFASLMPNFNKKLRESLKIETEFEIDRRRNNLKIKRHENLLETFEKIKKDLIKFLDENDYIFENQITFYDEPKTEQQTKKKNKKDEQSKKNDFIITKNIITNSADLDKNANTTEKQNKTITNDNRNKSEKNEFEFLFGQPITQKNEEEIPQDKLADLIYDEDNPKEITLEEPYTKEELKKISEINKQEFDNNYSFLFGETGIINSDLETVKQEPKIEKIAVKKNKIEESNMITPDLGIENEEEIPKKEHNSYSENPKYSKFYQAINKNAERHKIDAKIKKKEEKEKKEKLFKRFKDKIIGYFTEKDNDEIIEETKTEKGGRKK